MEETSAAFARRTRKLRSHLLKHLGVGAANVVRFQLLGRHRFAGSNLAPAQSSYRSGSNRRQGYDGQPCRSGRFRESEIRSYNLPSSCLRKKLAPIQHIFPWDASSLRWNFVLAYVDVAPACVQRGHNFAFLPAVEDAHL